MKTSIRGKVALASSEGIVPAVYLDSVGVPTYGVGVTHWAVGEESFSRFPVEMPLDIGMAVDGILDLYEVVLPQYENIVNDAIEVGLTQYQFDALVHFAYNVGGPNFRKSNLRKYINRGDFETAAAKGFHGWLKPKSLLGRRDLESAMFRGEYPTKKIPVYQTDDRMNLRGVIKTYDPFELVEMLKTPPGGGKIRKPAGHSPVERPSVDETMTAWLARAQKWAGGLGVSATAIIGAFKDLDPTVQLALLATVGGLTIYAIVTISSLIRRERAKHFAAGVK